MAKIFGQHGIWVDHVTILDPHPVSLYNDASVYLYWNILFADNYWQTNPDLFCPNGETIFGAYNRYLSNLIADTIVRTVTFTYGIMELLTSIRSLRTLRQILHQLTVRIGGQPM